MANFYSSWKSYGSGANMRLRVYIRDPSVSSSTTSLTLTYYVYLQCDSLYDSSNNFAMSGTFGSKSGAKSISNGSAGAEILIYSGSKSFSTSYTSTTTVSLSFSASNLATVSSMSVTGSVTIPKRPASVPGAPGKPSFSSIGPYGAKASWSTPSTNGSSLTQFQIQFDNQSFTSVNDEHIGSWATSHTTSNLWRAAGFNCRVRARNSVGWGSWSSVGTFTTLATVPDTPTVNYSNVQTTTATVSISDASSNGGASVTRRQIQYSTSSSFSGATTVSTTSTSRSITGLTRATGYYVRCRTYNSKGWSSWSASKNFTTLQSVPTSPQNVSVTDIQHDQVTVLFTAPSDNGGASITNYVVRLETSDGTSLSWTYNPSSPIIVTGLDPVTDYQVRVLAQNSVGNSSYTSAVSFTSGTGVPSQPTSVTVINVTDNAVTVDWSEPVDENGSAVIDYDVEVSVVGADPNVTSPHTVDDLDHTTDYSVRVAANNSNGRGEWSPWVDFTTLSRVPYAAVAPTFEGITANATKFVASVPTDDGGADITQYVFQFTETASDYTEADVLTESEAGKLLQLGLWPDTQYWVRSAAVNVNGIGEWSAEGTFTTLAGYGMRLPIRVPIASHQAPRAIAVLGSNVSAFASDLSVSSDVPAKLTIPNPLRMNTWVETEVPLESEANVGLHAETYIVRKLPSEVSLKADIRIDALDGFTVWLVDATVPSVESTPMFKVGLEIAVRKQPYGDALMDPDLDKIDHEHLTLTPVSETSTLGDGFIIPSTSGLPSDLRLEAVDGRVDM